MIATGGTAKSVANILKREKKELTGLITVVDLKEFSNKNRFDFPVDSMIVM